MPLRWVGQNLVVSDDGASKLLRHLPHRHLPKDILAVCGRDRLRHLIRSHVTHVEVHGVRPPGGLGPTSAAPLHCQNVALAAIPRLPSPIRVARLVAIERTYTRAGPQLACTPCQALVHVHLKTCLEHARAVYPQSEHRSPQDGRLLHPPAGAQRLLKRVGHAHLSDLISQLVDHDGLLRGRPRERRGRRALARRSRHDAHHVLQLIHRASDDPWLQNIRL